MSEVSKEQVLVKYGEKIYKILITTFETEYETQ